MVREEITLNKLRFAAVGLIAGAGVFGLTACVEPRPPQPHSLAMCMDPVTKVRIDDDFCETDEQTFAGYPWVWVPEGKQVPAQGDKFTEGNYSLTLPGGTRPDWEDFNVRGGTYTGTASSVDD